MNYSGGIIRNHRAYCEARQLVEAVKLHLSQEADNLLREGKSQEWILRRRRAQLNPLLREIESYEDAVLGSIPLDQEFSDLGRLLIRLRIANGLTDAELAERLGDVTNDDFARDEKTQNRWITIERAILILEAIGVKIRIVLESVDSHS
jgi:hypothetical protein